MPALLESLLSLLDEHDAAAVLSPRLGADEEAASTALGPAVARIIDGLAERATDGDEDGGDGSRRPTGSGRTVVDLVDRGDLLGGDAALDRFLAQGSTGPGNDILDLTFGAERGLVVIGLASGLGLAPSLVGRLLPLLAPVVVLELWRYRRDGLDDRALVDLLVAERRAIAASGLLDGTAFDESGLSGSGSRRAGRDHDLRDHDLRDHDLQDDDLRDHDLHDDERDGGDDRDDDRPERRPVTVGAATETVEVADLVVERPGDRGSGGPPWGPGSGHDTIWGRDDRDLEQVAPAGDGGSSEEGSSSVVALEEADAADEIVVVEPAGTGDESLATVAVAVAVAEGGEGGETDPLDPGPPRAAALAWLGWAVGAVILVLLLAGLLSTCSSEASRRSTPSTVVAVGPTLGEEVAGPAAVDPTGPPASIAPDLGVGTTTGTFGPGVALVDDALAAPPIDADLASAAQAVLAGTGITGEVTADGLTLMGTVESEEARLDAEARVAVLLGVDAIDNRIEVAAPVEVEFEPADVPAGPSGSTLNDLLTLAPVTFGESSADLTVEGVAVVAEVARYLQENPAVVIEIGGHTDSDGDRDANLALSQQRADAVLAELTAAGVPAQRVAAVGYGEDHPAVPNDSLDNKAVNRRIEFTIR